MHVWIQASSAAIGTLALFILMSATLSRGNPVTITSEETPTCVPEEVGDSPCFKISDLPFANFISNPCNPGTSRNNDRNRTRSQKNIYSLAFYRYMSTYGTLYKQDAQKIINESITDECRFLNFPSLPSTPSLLELMEMDGETALKKIHASLLLHTAHAYFVDHQYDPSTSTCPLSAANRERNLAKEAVILARKQKHMACMTQMTIEELGYSPSNTNHLMEQKLSDQRVCSRRALRDCQIMHSVLNLLDVISRYSQSWLESARVD